MTEDWVKQQVASLLDQAGQGLAQADWGLHVQREIDLGSLDALNMFVFFGTARPPTDGDDLGVLHQGFFDDLRH